MARLARLKDSTRRSWYHVCARIAGYRGDFPLAGKMARRHLVELIQRHAAIYFCSVAGFCVMGNHYHLVIRFDAEREVEPAELRRRARLRFGDREDLEGWSEERWERFRRRLFDISAFMQEVQSAFARWYNRTHERRGRFWADRFRSTLLEDDRAVVDCLLYVELNPVRAGLVERPEAWDASSARLRVAGLDGWLLPLPDLLGTPTPEQAVVEHRDLLYHRGAVPTRPGQSAIPPEVLEREARRGFAVRGVYRHRLRYFVDGLAVGSEAFVREVLGRLRDAGVYTRRRHPIRHLDGVHLSVREQRGTAVVF